MIGCAPSFRPGLVLRLAFATELPESEVVLLIGKDTEAESLRRVIVFRGSSKLRIGSVLRACGELRNPYKRVYCPEKSGVDVHTLCILHNALHILRDCIVSDKFRFHVRCFVVESLLSIAHKGCYIITYPFISSKERICMASQQRFQGRLRKRKCFHDSMLLVITDSDYVQKEFVFRPAISKEHTCSYGVVLVRVGVNVLKCRYDMIRSENKILRASS